MGTEAQIITVNAGSGSLRLARFAMAGDEPLAEAERDWRGEAGGQDRRAAAGALLEQLDARQVAAVGHRVVHGGDRYDAGVRVDDTVRSTIREFAPLAPQHNPVALELIEAFDELLPGVPQVAVFDTAFHRSLPPEHYLYGVPYEWHARWGVRRYGFHGLSHAYCAGRAAELLGRPAAGLRLVTCHLGSGCSLAAVRDGRSVATTMGFTPLDGVVMSSRSGALDPGLLLWLLEQGKLDVSELGDALRHRSGLKGLSGIAADTRDLVAARERGDGRAALALDVFTASVRQAIGAMAAAMGGLDALALTDGIGENSAPLRAEIVGPLAWLGLAIDAQKNRAARPDCDIGAPEAQVRTLVVRSRESLMIAREARRLLAQENHGTHAASTYS